jgi:hypothetical protein
MTFAVASAHGETSFQFSAKNEQLLAIILESRGVGLEGGR